MVIRAMREKNHSLPPDFASPELQDQGSIILSLINHEPAERPNCADLLNGGKVPPLLPDSTLQVLTQAVSNKSSPYHNAIIAALFQQGKTRDAIQDRAWDISMTNGSNNFQDAELSVQEHVKDRLTRIFRQHCALEVRRQSVFPWAGRYYPRSNAVKLLRQDGERLQL